MKTLEEIKKEIQELQFAINPTETKGVLWKWTKHGLDILSLYVESTISQTKQELIGEIIDEVVKLSSKYWIDKYVGMETPLVVNKTQFKKFILEKLSNK